MLSPQIFRPFNIPGLQITEEKTGFFFLIIINDGVYQRKEYFSLYSIDKYEDG
jgi:hypothetical protein